MGQLLEQRDCPTCGKPMALALPPGGKGRRVLQCMTCDRPDPIEDVEVVGWLHGELGSAPQPIRRGPKSR